MNNFKSERRKQHPSSAALNATSTFGAPVARQTPQEQDMTGLHAGHSLADFTIHSPSQSATVTPLQKVDATYSQKQADRPEQTPSEDRQKNRTGLPDSLKAGVESLSGYSLDDIRVHYNSPKPSEVGALAYTQGTEIHVGPGQEQHLAHEAWHVVQQKQGRVRATRQMKGVAINDDVGLEREADIKGKQVEQLSSNTLEKKATSDANTIGSISNSSISSPIQGMWWTWISGVWYPDDTTTTNPAPAHQGLRDQERFDDTPQAQAPITYVYDVHGDKHFSKGRGSKWDLGKSEALALMGNSIRAIEATILAHVEADKRVTIFYYTQESKTNIGKTENGKKTKCYTIQFEYTPAENNIGYHGYPEDNSIPLGLGYTKMNKVWLK